jgi:hypothetical protein
MDCIVILPEQRYRSLNIVARLWTAEDTRRCPEFTPLPTSDDIEWAHAVLRNHPRSRWARRVLDCVKMKSARNGHIAAEIMQASVDGWKVDDLQRAEA